MIDLSTKGKGFIPRQDDPRAIKYASLFNLIFKNSVDWVVPFDVRSIVGDLKVEDQGRSLSCVMQATSKYAEVLDKLETSLPSDLSAKDGYARIRETDGGAYGYKGMSLWKNRGIPEELVVSSYNNGQPPDEAFMSQVIDNPVITKYAEIHKIKSYAAVSPNIDEFAHAIKNSNGLVFGVVGSNEGWQSALVRPPRPGETTFGHFLYATGYKMLGERKYIVALNSWSAAYGNNGYNYIPEEYFTGGWVSSGFTAIDLPNLPASINMLDLIKLSDSVDQYIKVDNMRFKIPDLETKMFLRDKLKVILDTPRIVSQQEFDGLQEGTQVASQFLDMKFASLYPSLRDAYENNSG